MLVQVVERSEDQHDIEAVIGERQPAGIGNLRRQTSAGQPTHCLVDVPRGDVEEVHAIAVGQQPIGMYSGAPADVENPGGRSRRCRRRISWVRTSSSSARPAESRSSSRLDS